MKINIYYGGRGIVDDPTLFVLEKIEKVFEELRVNYQRFNIYEYKNVISTLPGTLKDADGVILATTLEWMGIGGYMQQFLDAVWLYGDKEKIKNTYMQGVVMAQTFGEKEALLTLNNAWEIFGGLTCTGFTGYVQNLAEFKSSTENISIIEKQAENLYRTISQKIKALPTSNQVVGEKMIKAAGLNLTPQESERLSKYVSDDSYVKKQQEDIEELKELFKGKMTASSGGKKDLAEAFMTHFNSGKVTSVDLAYEFIIDEKEKGLCLEIKQGELFVRLGHIEKPDEIIKLKEETLEKIVDGRMTFQRGFMTGELAQKGDFKLLSLLDDLFVFTE